MTHLGLGDLDPYGSNLNYLFTDNLTWCTLNPINNVSLQGSQKTKGITKVDEETRNNQYVAQPFGATPLGTKGAIHPPPQPLVDQQPNQEVEGPSLTAPTTEAAN